MKDERGLRRSKKGEKKRREDCNKHEGHKREELEEGIEEAKKAEWKRAHVT